MLRNSPCRDAEVSPPTSSTLCRRQARIIPRYRRSTPDEDREAGIVPAAPVFSGLRPMDDESLTMGGPALLTVSPEGAGSGGEMTASGRRAVGRQRAGS